MDQLWRYCADGDLVKVQEILLLGDEFVNSKTPGNNVTGLMWAIMYQHNSIVKLLLEQRRIDVNCKSEFGMTALHYATKYGNSKAAQLISARVRREKLQQKAEKLQQAGFNEQVRYHSEI